MELNSIHFYSDDTTWFIWSFLAIFLPALINLIIGWLILIRKKDEEDIFYWKGETHRGWLIVGYVAESKKITCCRCEPQLYSGVCALVYWWDGSSIC